MRAPPHSLPVVDEPALVMKIVGPSSSLSLHEVGEAGRLVAIGKPHARRYVIDRCLELPALEQDLHAFVREEHGVHGQVVEPGWVVRDFFANHRVQR